MSQNCMKSFAYDKFSLSLISHANEYMQSFFVQMCLYDRISHWSVPVFVHSLTIIYAYYYLI